MGGGGGGSLATEGSEEPPPPPRKKRVLLTLRSISNPSSLTGKLAEKKYDWHKKRRMRSVWERILSS